MVKLMEAFILGLKKTDYEQRYIYEKAGNERCIITIPLEEIRPASLSRRPIP
jgi:hypothetical protein